MKKKVLIALVVVLALAATASLVWATAVSLTIVSDTSVMVYGPLDHYAPLGDMAWGEPGLPVATWDSRWPSISDATWISTASMVEDGTIDTWRWFHGEMTLPCTAYNISGGTVDATADNAEEFYFNGVWVYTDGEVQVPYHDNGEWKSITTKTINPQPGVNTLDFIVRNYDDRYPTADGATVVFPNPTGLIYKATVNYEVPDVVWQPPVTNADFALKDGTTLPLKFKLYMQDPDGTLITDMQDVYMTVSGAGLPAEGVTWYLGDGVDSLRFDYTEYYYIANFQTRNYELAEGATYTYTAIVHDGCTGEPLGDIPFVLNVKAGRGNSGK